MSIPRSWSAGVGLNRVYCHLFAPVVVVFEGSVVAVVAGGKVSASVVRLHAMKEIAIVTFIHSADCLRALITVDMMGSYLARIRSTGTSILCCTLVAVAPKNRSANKRCPWVLIATKSQCFA